MNLQQHKSLVKNLNTVIKATDCINILNHLENNNSSTVSDIVAKLKIPQTVVSMNLRRLRNVNLVTRKKEGRHRIYSLNKEKVNNISDILNMLQEEVVLSF